MQPDSPSTDHQVIEASGPFVTRWHHLVSTTNWEKGRIIHEWRTRLAESGAAVGECSDEAWCRLVGGVTGQHAGRLRRVWQRFGQVYSQYPGLYWSHFQAALDWEDAEMWLEGALQSEWSVSQMRRRRWETLGKVAADEPRDDDPEAAATELDEDFEPALGEMSDQAIGQMAQAVDPEARGERTGRSDADEEDSGRDVDGAATSSYDRQHRKEENGEGANIYSPDRPEESAPFVRPFANLADLPDDLSEAFESFKLAILRHKTAGWSEVSRDDVLGSLDALKELALAPSADDAPF